MKNLFLVFCLVTFAIGFANLGIMCLACRQGHNRRLRQLYLTFLSLGLYALLGSLAEFYAGPQAPQFMSDYPVFLGGFCLANSLFLLVLGYFGHKFSPLAFAGLRKALYFGLSCIPFSAWLIDFGLNQVTALGSIGVSGLLSLNLVLTLSLGFYFAVSWWLKRAELTKFLAPYLLRYCLVGSMVSLPAGIIITGLSQGSAALPLSQGFATLYFLAGSLISFVYFSNRFSIAPKPESAGTTATQAKPNPPLALMESSQLQKLGITEREKQIIALVCRGCSNRDIADALYIEPVTVKNHLYKIYQKTRVNNRIGLNNLVLRGSAQATVKIS